MNKTRCWVKLTVMFVATMVFLICTGESFAGWADSIYGAASDFAKSLPAQGKTSAQWSKATVSAYTSSSASSSSSSSTTTKEQSNTQEAVSEKPEDYKNATTYAEADNADIKSVAENLTKNCTTDKAKAQAIFDYVSQNYAYKYYYRTAAGAEEMLGKKEGNGADQSHLFVALCRAAGLSARYQHAMTGNAAGMGDGVPNEVDRIYAQVYVDGKWQNADPADKRNKNVGDLTVTVKGDIATYNEYKNKNETNVTLSAKTKLTSAEVTAYNKFQTVVNQNGVLNWPAQAESTAVKPLTFEEVKDYLKYQKVEKIGENHFWLNASVNKEPLTSAEIESYKKYQTVKRDGDGWPYWDKQGTAGQNKNLTLDECKEYIKYSAVVKDGEKYYWSQAAVPTDKDKGKTTTGTETADAGQLDPALSKKSGSSAIQAKSDQLTAGKTTDYDKAKAIYDWVNSSKSYAYYENTSKGAVGMLTAGSGNCCDQAHLIVALARDAGLPARYVHNTSCTFTDGTFGHVWAQIYAGGDWVDADAVSSRDSFGRVAFTTNRNNDRIYDTLPF